MPSRDEAHRALPEVVTASSQVERDAAEHTEKGRDTHPNNVPETASGTGAHRSTDCKSVG